jgi:DNA-directed RNA polymerase specialized sigma24 family protein
VVVPLDREVPGTVCVEDEVADRVTTEWLLAGLPAREREAVTLIDMEDKSWVEVERLMGTQDGTIARWRVQGLQRMRQVI